MTDSPSAARVSPPMSGDEAATLIGFLDYHRATLRLKTDGLDHAQLSTSLPPSSLSLGGLIKHLAGVEAWWFSTVLPGNDESEPWASADWDSDPDWDFHIEHDDPDDLRALLEQEIESSDAHIADALARGGLDQLAALSVRDGQPNLRWLLVHVIEEYARHNGHADLIRESIDGATGE